jgi:hypothetical protein
MKRANALAEPMTVAAGASGRSAPIPERLEKLGRFRQVIYLFPPTWAEPAQPGRQR